MLVHPPPINLFTIFLPFICAPLFTIYLMKISKSFFSIAFLRTILEYFLIHLLIIAMLLGIESFLFILHISNYQKHLTWQSYSVKILRLKMIVATYMQYLLYADLRNVIPQKFVIYNLLIFYSDLFCHVQQ